jgi:hypothetical protein
LAWTAGVDAAGRQAQRQADGALEVALSQIQGANIWRHMASRVGAGATDFSRGRDRRSQPVAPSCDDDNIVNALVEMAYRIT